MGEGDRGRDTVRPGCWQEQDGEKDTAPEMIKRYRMRQRWVEMISQASSIRELASTCTAVYIGN